MNSIPLNWKRAALRYLSRYTKVEDLDLSLWYHRPSEWNHVVLCFRDPEDHLVDCEIVIDPDDHRKVQFDSALVGLELYYSDLHKPSDLDDLIESLEA